jgi:hypothetical protein
MNDIEQIIKIKDEPNNELSRQSLKVNDYLEVQSYSRVQSNLEANNNKIFTNLVILNFF